MKTATLTFHGSHNYGSMLQSYALQKVMIRVFGENEIINFRSPRQKRMMRVITMRPHLGPILKDITHLFFYRALSKKHNLFEKFLSTNLKLSHKEIPTVQLGDLTDYELICCGSDQIWNPGPEDFDISYLLPFNIKAKKISYAASMGPGREKWQEPISRFPELLKDFDAISVRESGTRDVVFNLTGRTDISVHCDPVFLLERNCWIKLISKNPLVEGRYIFLYTLYADSLIINCAKALSKKYGLPVIISNYTNLHDLLSSFKKIFNSGPKEFLNLLFNAEMIITSSFHGTAFAILLNKPFVTINGLNDNRISNLLMMTGLASRSVSSPDEILDINWQIDFTQANIVISEEREKALKYLSDFNK